MESLIFFLVVIIIIVTNILKVQKKLKESKPRGEDKPKGWKDNLRDLLSEIQKEMEKASQESGEQKTRRGRPSGWDQVLPPEPSDEVEAFEAPPRKAEPVTAARPTAVKKEPRPVLRGETLIESRSRRGQTPEARMEQAEQKSVTPVRDRGGMGIRQTPLYGADTYTYPDTFGAEQRPCRPRRYGRKQLQRAVIWYEVLGPPMSLRDPEREMWL